MPTIDLSRYEKKKTAKAHKGSERSGLIAFLNKDISFGSRELDDKKKQSMYLELGSLLVAGVNLKSSLELISADQEKAKDKELFTGIKDKVLNGMTLAKAMETSGRFSMYEIYSVQIGEETGQLNEVLQDTAKFYEQKVKQRRKIISTLTYPCVVLATAFGAVFFMLKFVVPMFGDVFRQFGGHLPWITEKIISTSEAVQHYFLPFAVVIIASFALLWRVRKTDRYRRIASGLLLRIPIAGGLVQKIYLARFCNSMRLLIKARVPLLRAIALSRQMIGWYPIEVSLDKIEYAILSGKPLYQSMQEFVIYPAKMIQLIKVGEETNQLDYFFARISEQYIDEIEYRTSALSSTMEPLIIIFLGIIVGIILVAMYLPLFQMSNSFQ